MKRFLTYLIAVVAGTVTCAQAQNAKKIDCAGESPCKVSATMSVDPSGVCKILVGNTPLNAILINPYRPPWLGRQKVFAFEVTPPENYVFGAIPFAFYKLSVNGQKDGPYQISDIRYGSDDPSAKAPGIVVAADGSKATFYLRTNAGGLSKEEFFFGVAAASKVDPLKGCVVDPKVVNGE